MAMQAPLKGDDAGDGFNVVVHETEEVVKVAAVDGVDSSTRQLDVLLRHRPPSIALCPTSRERGSKRTSKADLL
jgi:hypothetical protein